MSVIDVRFSCSPVVVCSRLEEKKRKDEKNQIKYILRLVNCYNNIQPLSISVGIISNIQ